MKRDRWTDGKYVMPFATLVVSISRSCNEKENGGGNCYKFHFFRRVSREYLQTKKKYYITNARIIACAIIIEMIEMIESTEDPIVDQLKSIFSILPPLPPFLAELEGGSSPRVEALNMSDLILSRRTRGESSPLSRARALLCNTYKHFEPSCATGFRS